MYAQFFGNYLLTRELVSTEQLLIAISDMAVSKLSLGTIALYKGILTADEVESVYEESINTDKRFGEIAMTRGYLNWNQAEELIREEHPDFLLLAQCLVQNKALSFAEVYDAFLQYQTDSELYNLEVNISNKERLDALIKKFFVLTEIRTTEYATLYLNLIFENLIRFIGEDFVIKTPFIISEYPINFCTSQSITGTRANYICHIDMDKKTAIEFASRYAGEDFSKFDEFVEASIQDFLNLQNGVFIVNMSNQYAEELNLAPPYIEPSGVLNDGHDCLVIPVAYTFGTFNLMVTF